MQAIRSAISEGRYAVDPAGVAQALLARIAVPEPRAPMFTADAGRAPAAGTTGPIALSLGGGGARSRGGYEPGATR